MPIPNEAALTLAAEWVVAFTALVLGLRQLLKTLKSDERDRKVINAEIAQMDRGQDELEDKCALIIILRQQLHDLDAIERRAAPDVALIGEYLRQLKDRPCEIAEDGKCPAQTLCERFEGLYKKIEARRKEKEIIFSRRVSCE